MSYSSSESNTFSRRYELPTCLLEVWTERSPLSDWQSQIVAQNLRFCLQLADGRKAIKGNQQQIVHLIEAVTSYCDRWLADDGFETLDHVIEIPKLSRLKLTTLQLFDLYESIELCANEFVILPNVLLEVRRHNLNWLKIMAGTIAIMGVSIGTIRLIFPPFGEQHGYQIASTPNASSPEKAAAPPLVSSDKAPDKSENASKIANSSKTANPSTPNAAIAPAVPNDSKSSQDRNRVQKTRERTDKVAIAPEPINSPRDNEDRYRQGATASSPAVSDGMTFGRTLPQLRRSETKDAPQTAVRDEATKPAPSAPKLSNPSAATRSANTDIATATNIKILQIQSELPSDVNTDLVRYLQAQRIAVSESGTIVLDLEITGDRISNISIDNQNSTLNDSNAIAELDNIIHKWRSPNSVTGKVHLVLQI